MHLTDDDLAAEMGRRKAAASSDDDLAAEMKKRKGQANKGDAAEVTKSAAELLVEKQAEVLQKQAELVQKMAADIEILKGERDHAVLVTKAKDMLGDVGALKPDELAGILKKLDDKERTAMETLLKSANNIQRDSGLHLVRGSADASEPDAISEINKAAAELMKSDPDILKADPAVREDLAITKALEQNPDLYDAYEREHPTPKASGE